MVLMVGGVAWLVSRQVLNPVRLARRIAERYAPAAWSTHARHGEDDIARLSTSFNQMAASLQSQIRRLENLSRLQQRFVSDVSHELRTPLTTVQMASGVLFEARDRFDPQTARSAELLKSELDRFEELLSTCSTSAGSTPVPPGSSSNRSISLRSPEPPATTPCCNARASRCGWWAQTSRPSSRPTSGASTGSSATS